MAESFACAQRSPSVPPTACYPTNASLRTPAATPETPLSGDWVRPGKGVFRSPQMISVLPSLRTFASVKQEDGCLTLCSWWSPVLMRSTGSPCLSLVPLHHLFWAVIISVWFLHQSQKTPAFYLPEILWHFWYNHGILSGVTRYYFKNVFCHFHGVSAGRDEKGVFSPSS